MNQSTNQNHAHLVGERVLHLALVLLGAFTAVALGLFFWSALRAPELLLREDNPRQVEAALRIQRGQILDRHGTVLATTAGPADRVQRHYPIPNIGPAVGYYSFQHGAAGIEEGYNAILSGAAQRGPTAIWRELLNLPQRGADVQLTLDAGMQQRADSLLGAQPGAILLLELPHHKQDAALIRALVSHPTYDPNRLDATFEALTAAADAPLLNRVTQGEYQPGLLLQPLLLAAALDDTLLTLDGNAPNPNHPVRANGTAVACITPAPEPATWEEVLHLRCPGPLVALAETQGEEWLTALFSDFGLTRQPPLEIETAPAPSFAVDDVQLATIGQERLTVTPLQVGLAFATLLTGGPLPQPHLVAERESVEDNVLSSAVKNEDTAVALLQALPSHGPIREHSVRVPSGPQGSTNVWYVGLLPGETADTAVVVVLEAHEDLNTAQSIGRQLLLAGNETP